MTKIVRALAAGAVFVVPATFVVGALEVFFQGAEIIGWFVVPALVSTFVVGTAMWALIVLSSGAPGPDLPTKRGVFAGLATGVLTHPLTVGGSYLLHREGRSFGDVLLHTIWYSFWTLLLTGWLTGGVSALVGWQLSRRRFFRG